MRRLAGALVAGFLITGSAVAIAAPAGAASDISDIGNASLQSVASCVNSSHKLVAAIVVDNSGSLKNTDPQKQRFAAIETVLDALESLATQNDGSVDVQATLATFGATYNTVVGWGDVTGSHGDQLRRAVKSTLPKLESDPITDYRAALKGAQASLNDQATSDECKLMLWFTDGKLDVDNSGGTGQANKDARNQLCTEQGIVDGVRGDEIAITALALFTDSGPGSTKPADRSLLQSISEGTDGKATCGKDPIPRGWVNGAYLRADDADALNQVFAQAGALIGGGQEAQGLGCPGPRCLNGNLMVAVDQGIPRVRIVTDAHGADGAISVTPPGGSPTPLAEGSQDIGAASVTATAGGLTTIDIAVPRSGEGHGDWLVALGDSGATATVYYFWDARLELSAPDDFVIGEPGEVGVTFVDASTGAKIDPTLYERVTLVAGADGATVEPSADSRTITVTPGAEGAATSLAVEATVKATTAPTGVQLGPITATTGSVAVKPPASYPTIDSKSLAFPEMKGTTESTATLTMTGSSEGDTTACFQGSGLVGPGGTVSLVPTGLADNCVTLSANQQQVINFTLSSENKADGRIDGTVKVTMSGVNTDQELTMSVPVTARMSIPVDKKAEALWVAAFVILAIVIAWLTARVGRHFADRFRFGPGAQYAAVDVLVTPQGLTRIDKRQGDLLDPAEDFHRVSSIGNSATTTSMDIDALQYRRKAPFNPWQAARGVTSAPGRVVGFGQHAEMEAPDGSLARAPFPGTTEFVISADARDITPEQISGRLVMVLDAPDGVSSVLPDRLADLRQVQWPDLIVAFNAAAAVARENASQGSVVEKGLGARLGASSGDGSAAPAQDFTGSSEPGAPSATQPAPAQSWLLDDAPNASTLPPASTGKRRGRDKRAEKPSKSKSKPAPPSDPPAGAGSPHPPTDFLS
jgi:hypothetical protein